MRYSVLEYLDETAAKYPNKTALVDEHRSVTFTELRESARRIATTIAKRKIFHQPVAIYLNQSVESVICMMGVAYSGNFYSIIDTKMPTPRIAKIFETLCPAAILTDNKLSTKLPDVDAEIFQYETLTNEIDEPLLNRIARKINYMDVLYVLFTSGSTGVPKGVTIGQRSVIEYTDWVTNTFGVNENTILGNQAPFYFDNSVLDIYQTLKTGATLHIIPRAAFMFPAKLLKYIEDNAINMVFWVPSILTTTANLGVLNDFDISCLKKILFAGEVMPAKQLNQWRRRLPDSMFANLYGPTEITVDCTYYIVNREFGDADAIPIGYPCREGDVLILNDADKLVEGSEQGELCVRGSSLAYGYYNNPEKTAEAFVQNPTSDYPEIMYRTGDLVHYNERGEIIFDGRKDFQIKHMGYRIELGEIETAVLALDGVKEGCCLHDKSANEIVLCYVGDVTSAQIVSRLTTILPKYMIPTRYEQLAEMPHNANGKIDRRLLNNKFIG